MDAIWQGLSGIFEVVLIAGLGFFLAKKGWFWENAAKDLTKLTMTVALPPLMIHSLYANFTHDALIAAAPDLVLPFVSIFVAYLAGHVLASLLHISKGRRGIFICTCCIANAIFIGVPVNVALFGREREASAAFQDGEEDDHAVVVIARCDAARNSEDGVNRECLDLYKDRTQSLHAGDDGGTGCLTYGSRSRYFDGSSMPLSPCPSMTKSPDSAVEPKRFFTVLSTRNW